MFFFLEGVGWGEPNRLVSGSLGGWFGVNKPCSLSIGLGVSGFSLEGVVWSESKALYPLVRCYLPSLGMAGVNPKLPHRRPGPDAPKRSRRGAGAEPRRGLDLLLLLRAVWPPGDLPA